MGASGDSAGVRLAEHVAILASGQDNAFGQPTGSQLRTGVLASRLAEAMALGESDRATVYWVPSCAISAAPVTPTRSRPYSGTTS